MSSTTQNNDELLSYIKDTLTDLASRVATKEDLAGINKRLDEHDKLLIRGNGHPPLTTQVALMQSTIATMQANCARIHSDPEVEKNTVTWSWMRGVIQSILVALIIGGISYLIFK